MRTRSPSPGRWLVLVASLAACGSDDPTATDPASGGSSGQGGAGAGGSPNAGTGGTRPGGASGASAGAASGASAGGSSGASAGGATPGGAAGAQAGGASGAQAGGASGSSAGGAAGGGGKAAGGAAGQATGPGGAGGATSGAGGAGGASGGASGASGSGPGCEPGPVLGALAVVPTFESMGLTLTGVAQAGGGNVANVAFRAQGSSAWRPGLPLVHDAKKSEYRGSIVHLTPGTSYEVRVMMADTCEIVSTQVATWSETFPIGKTIKVPAKSSTPLEITESGSPDGYLLVEPAGGSAVIDVNHKADYNLRVTGSHVIVRGLTLRGASKHGIILGADSVGAAVHDVIIERNDVSGWGTNYVKDGKESLFGVNLQSALYSNNPGLERIVVQRNVLHDPATTSNSWKETNDQGGSAHPGGPQGITFRGSQGHHVIRYNEIYGNPEHHFNDAMGEVQNFTEGGFPNRDTDIHGNYIAYTWDDGLELEGANRNVRVWGNYIDHTYLKIAIAPVSVGPIYIWRNVGDVSQTSSINATELKKGQGFFKSRNYGGGDTNFGLGAKFVFNNTSLTPTTKESGSFGFLSEYVDGNATQLDNLLSYTLRNNIAHVAKDHASFKDVNGDPARPSDFDYDMYDGSASFSPTTLGQEAHGLPATTPQYVTGYGFDLETRRGVFSLAAGTPGVDAGVVIPNFIETFSGAAPDMGAHESGDPPMEFGTSAHLP